MSTKFLNTTLNSNKFVNCVFKENELEVRNIYIAINNLFENLLHHNRNDIFEIKIN